jgi:hypothetical protein
VHAAISELSAAAAARGICPSATAPLATRHAPTRPPPRTLHVQVPLLVRAHTERAPKPGRGRAGGVRAGSTSPVRHAPGHKRH